MKYMELKSQEMVFKVIKVSNPEVMKANIFLQLKKGHKPESIQLLCISFS